MARPAARTLQRKNFMVDAARIRRLKHILHAPSESEAVRAAVERALDAEDAIGALERLRRRGSWGRRLA
jgi:hypothetical protein